MKHKQTRAKYSALLPRASDRQHWEDVPVYSLNPSLPICRDAAVHHDTELSPPQVSPTKVSFPLKEFSAWCFYVPHRPLGKNVTFKDYCSSPSLCNTKLVGMLIPCPSFKPRPSVREQWSHPVSAEVKVSVTDGSHWLRINRLGSDFEESFLESTHYFIVETLSIINPICSG